MYVVYIHLTVHKGSLSPIWALPMTGDFAHTGSVSRFANSYLLLPFPLNDRRVQLSLFGHHVRALVAGKCLQTLHVDNVVCCSNKHGCVHI